MLRPARSTIPITYLAVMGMMIVVVMPFFNGLERPIFQFLLIPCAVIGGTPLITGTLKQRSQPND
jgi:hypothetical protein